jgi:hypothetical protein
LPPGGRVEEILGLLDRQGNYNQFEATIKYTYNAATRYFPVGTALWYDDPDKVLSIFQAFGWFRLMGTKQTLVESIRPWPNTTAPSSPAIID